MHFATLIAATSVLAIASAGPVTKRALIDLSKISSSTEKQQLVGAQIDAVRLANAALYSLEHKSNEASTRRIFSLYFPTDEHTQSRVKGVFSNIAGDPRINEASGSPALGHFAAVPATDVANCADSYTLAKTTDLLGGKTTVQLCPKYFKLQSLEESLEKCKSLKKISNDLDNSGAILLQQFTYATAIGESEGVSITDRTYEAYSLEKAQAIAKSKPQLAVSSADNYKWFALHTYLQNLCADINERL